MTKRPKAAPAEATTPVEGIDTTLLVVAVHRINGTIEPNTPFLAADQRQYDELFGLEAVREPTDAEELVWSQQQAAKAGVTPADPAPEPTADGGGDENPLG
jgi:hypothetical protein